jgi:hypothetical protein
LRLSTVGASPLPIGGLTDTSPSAE